MPIGCWESEEKKECIVQEAIPYLTLLWAPGHIMLYLGTYHEEPVILHSLWGIKTWDLLQGEKRHVVGRSVITTLAPGKELPNLAGAKALLVNRITQMTYIVPNSCPNISQMERKRAAIIGPTIKPEMPIKAKPPRVESNTR